MSRYKFVKRNTMPEGMNLYLGKEKMGIYWKSVNPETATKWYGFLMDSTVYSGMYVDNERDMQLALLNLCRGMRDSKRKNRRREKVVWEPSIFEGDIKSYIGGNAMCSTFYISYSEKAGEWVLITELQEGFPIVTHHSTKQAAKNAAEKEWALHVRKSRETK